MLILLNLLNINPMMVSLNLILYTLLVCLFMNMLKGLFWYSYMLYLIIIGGVMILFMYFTSLVNNEKLFYLNKNIKMEFFLYIILFMFFFLIFDFYLNYEMKDFFMFLYKKEYYFILKSLYMNLFLDLNIFLMLYLFFTMTFIVFMCLSNLIPLRKLN
uniref:NADH dehydrogenase subunit 6 n=1 Tax=Chelonus formosanus TaxID=2739011 RepID=A0A8K1UKP0_9HYME|nr:NADH dehydrogenase subunit 6 [Chelonus formosanus]